MAVLRGRWAPILAVETFSMTVFEPPLELLHWISSYSTEANTDLRGISGLDESQYRRRPVLL